MPTFDKRHVKGDSAFDFQLTTYQISPNTRFSNRALPGPNENQMPWYIRKTAYPTSTFPPPPGWFFFKRKARQNMIPAPTARTMKVSMYARLAACVCTV